MKKLMIPAALILLLLAACSRTDDNDLAERLALLEEGAPVDAVELEPEEIKKAKSEINKVDEEVKDIIAAVRQKSTLYRTLGLKYMDYRMFSLAVASFDDALEIEPGSSRVRYYKGVALGQAALQEENSSLKKTLLQEAEQSYLAAIREDPRFTPPYYALAVLLTYELDRGEEAIPYLETYLAIQKSDNKARLLLAGLKTEVNDKTGALGLLNDAIREASDELKAEAEIRKSNILKGGR